MTILKIKNSWMYLAFLVIFTFSLYSQQDPKVAEEAIKGEPVKFINRTNRIAPAYVQQKEIENGRVLAQGVLANKQSTGNNINVTRYFDPSVEKYGADVMILTEKTNFGHVTAIQRVLMGYLEKSFGYKRNQALVLSEMLLYYNVSLRNNPKVLQESYEQEILKHINQANAGIDRNYRNWAGKTNLFIPLKKNVVRPGDTDLDRKEIQDQIEKDKTVPQEKKEEMKKVDEQIRKEDDKKIDQKMEELKKQEDNLKKKEEEVKRQEQNVQKEIVDTNKKLEELRKDPEKNKEQIKQEEKKVEQLKQEQQKVEEQKKEVQQQQQEVQKQQQEVQQQKQENKTNQSEPTRKEEVKQENQQQQQTTQNQTQQPQEDKKEPATKTEQTIQQLEKEKEELKKELEKKEQVSENVIGEKITFLKVLRYIEQGHYNNELWMIDTAKDDTLFRSPFNNICGKNFLAIENLGIVIIGYEGDQHDSEHKLYLMDPNTLAVKLKSSNGVFWNTVLIYRDQVIYAVLKENDKYYLAKFDDKLQVKEKSSSEINPYSEISFFKDKIYVTGPPKNNQHTIQVYKRDGLQLIKTIDSQSGTVSK